MNDSALLEIGVEHLPARFVADTLAQMENLAKARLAENNIGYTSLRAFGTFRKLALEITGVEEKAKDIEKEVKGPPAKMLKGADGGFTPQSRGFAEKNGVKPENLVVKDTPNGPFIFAEIKIKGEKSQKILPQIFVNIIKGLQFPKNMVWEESGLRFARPIRTLIGLYGDKVLKFEIAGVKSDRFTWPVSSFGTRPVKIASPEKYALTLKNLPQPVLIEPTERETALAKAINKEAQTRGLKAVIDVELLKETVFMTEHPVAVPGNFEIRFLTLPKELIVTVLKKQLKMFHMENSKGNIEPYFIAVRDGVSVNQDEVRDGFKKVMSARLSDAVFFFEQDSKKGLNFFREKLRTVRFIDGLGTMLDKTDRTKKLAVWLAEKTGADKAAVSKIADYAYADLTTSVVYEFPELQGYMGGVYAAKENLGGNVSRGIAEFYLPLTASSELPETLEGALVSLAGKMDAITGNFAAGQIPSGSEDPFALRRQAMGIARMLKEFNMPVTVDDLIKNSIAFYDGKAEKAETPLAEFFKARVENLLEQKGFEKNIINAVSFHTDKTVNEIIAIASALQNMKNDEGLAAVAESAKRVLNILKKASFETGPVDEKYFEHDAEKSLFAKFHAAETELKKYSGKNLTPADYEKMFEVLAGFKTELAAFFDAVMVNAENQSVRANRLNLLFKISALLTGLADITKLN